MQIQLHAHTHIVQNPHKSAKRKKGKNALKSSFSDFYKGKRTGKFPVQYLQKFVVVTVFRNLLFRDFLFALSTSALFNASVRFGMSLFRFSPSFSLFLFLLTALLGTMRKRRIPHILCHNYFLKKIFQVVFRM